MSLTKRSRSARRRQRGRENAGYGGLFWRGPSLLHGRPGRSVRTASGAGAAMRGQRHEWMAYAGHHDVRGRGIRHRLRGSIVNNPHHPPQWFVRTEEFACVQSRTVLQRGTRLSPVVRPSLFRYAVGIADATAGRPRRRRASREQRYAYPASRRCRRGDEVMTGQTTFPGGTSVTLLDVYDDAGPDGLRGGTPHMHLASTECYVVIGGRGALHTLYPRRRARDRTGARRRWCGSRPAPSTEQSTKGDLKVLVLMGNSGLPEAGDAVMTFPAGCRRGLGTVLPEGDASAAGELGGAGGGCRAATRPCSRWLCGSPRCARGR